MKTIRILLLAVLLPFVASAQTEHSQKHKHVAGSVREHQKNDSLVRGVSYSVFVASVADFADSTKKTLAKTAWQLWKHEQWAELEQFFSTNNLNGGWPPNRGALSLKMITLQAGLLVDRYGGYYDADSVFQDKGTFVSFVNVPFPQRALPDKTLQSPYRVYKIVKPIADVKKGQIIPWFNKPGLGIQFELPYNINDLKKGGYIAEQKDKERPR
ncbi:TNT domain-containing protein [Mucilaginibacter ginsenosidivorax]|uniref:DUF4237 domain-containing protein n=1 Tax=Mucilaginibacter ginsenosidivorax TaxID=862126 RepID=A0A5B8W4I3_9SPHI|nr:TNT domain-containing protein [Mucilaginibacter ginsenosidivorax]QEC78327.1 DUF4237 domain-containing protein [Mucilaginibacter ginsenosidivorax]